VAATLVGTLPIGMGTLAIVAFIQRTTGSYAAAVSPQAVLVAAAAGTLIGTLAFVAATPLAPRSRSRTLRPPARASGCSEVPCSAAEAHGPAAAVRAAATSAAAISAAAISAAGDF